MNGLFRYFTTWTGIHQLKISDYFLSPHKMICPQFYHLGPQQSRSFCMQFQVIGLLGKTYLNTRKSLSFSLSLLGVGTLLQYGTACLISGPKQVVNIFGFLEFFDKN